MHSKDNAAHQDPAIGYPATWDKETLRKNWLQFLKTLIDESELSVPIKRFQFQVEQSAVYQDIIHRWSGMSESERLDAWMQLLQSCEQSTEELLPSCVQCGECCRKSSPTLQVEDLELLRDGKIPWSRLYTLRKGEPVHSPFEEKLFFLLDERIKVREKDGTRECVFLDADTDGCTIYSDRPVQCRAQACWDPTLAKQLAEQPYLTRRDIFAGVDLILQIVSEHDSRCGFEKLNAAFQKLEESKGGSVEEVLELLAYEDHFRRFMGEQLKVPEDTMDLVFGRSFSELVSLFGFQVREEADSTRCLVPESYREG